MKQFQIACPRWVYFAVMTESYLRRKGFIPSYILESTITKKGLRQEPQVGPGSETMEEWCFLACYPFYTAQVQPAQR